MNALGPIFGFMDAVQITTASNAVGETVAMVANLLVGGHDTTASQIGCSLFALLGHPRALAELDGEPARLASLVDETLRFEPAIRGAPRTAARPIEICGAEHPGGTLVMCSFVAAHSDPEVCREPDSFLPQRFADPRAPRLLAFGGGPHYCLGDARRRRGRAQAHRGSGVDRVAPLGARRQLVWRQLVWCWRRPQRIKTASSSPSKSASPVTSVAPWQRAVA